MGENFISCIVLEWQEILFPPKQKNIIKTTIIESNLCEHIPADNRNKDILLRENLFMFFDFPI